MTDEHPMADLERLLGILQRAGVTRYKREGLEIELNPTAAPGPVMVTDRPNDVPPDEELLETPSSGLAVDHEALAERLAQRRQALERGDKR